MLRSANLERTIEQASAADRDQGLAQIDAAILSARKDGLPAEEIMLMLARSTICWNHGDFAASDQAIQVAEQALIKLNDEERAEAIELVEAYKAQRAEANLLYGVGGSGLAGSGDSATTQPQPPDEKVAES